MEDFAGYLADVFGAIQATYASWYQASMGLQNEIYMFVADTMGQFFGFIMDLFNG